MLVLVVLWLVVVDAFLVVLFLVVLWMCLTMMLLYFGLCWLTSAITVVLLVHWYREAGKTNEGRPRPINNKTNVFSIFSVFALSCFICLLPWSHLSFVFLPSLVLFAFCPSRDRIYYGRFKTEEKGLLMQLDTVALHSSASLDRKKGPSQSPTLRVVVNRVRKATTVDI